MARQSLIREFISQLNEAEKTGDPSRLVEMFDEKAELKAMTRPTQGDTSTETAAQFWGQYLAAFSEIHSQIAEIIETDGKGVLEWHSSGTLATGLPVEYCGVSILEHDGEHIMALRTYFDSAALLPHASHTSKPFSETVGLPDLTNQVTS